MEKKIGVCRGASNRPRAPYPYSPLERERARERESVRAGERESERARERESERARECERASERERESRFIDNQEVSKGRKSGNTASGQRARELY
jgi:hypothetical protein